MRNFGLSRPAFSLGNNSIPDPPGHADFVVPSINHALPPKQLPAVLSIVAGCVDVIGFLALDGLFTAHITGNIVVLAARFVAGEQASLARLLAVPVFMLALLLTRLLAAWLERAQIRSLLPLLLLELFLLIAFFILGVIAGPGVGPDAPILILAGMLGISAMAVQNALVRICLIGAPSTAVMTTNVTTFAIDLGELLLGQDADRVTKALERARSTGSAIAGFVIGCVLGAACEHIFGLRSLAVPIGLVLSTFPLCLAATRLQRGS